MALIEWNDSLSVNVAEIDEQHKKLIGLINDLHAAMSAGKSNDMMGGILNELVEYTKYHFSSEEKYMDQFHYPGTLVHKKEHEGFVNKALEFKGNFESGNASISVDLLNFLKDWLINHIQGTDKRYSNFFNEKGLK